MNDNLVLLREPETGKDVLAAVEASAQSALPPGDVISRACALTPSFSRLFVFNTKTSGKLGPNRYRKGPRDRLICRTITIVVFLGAQTASEMPQIGTFIGF